MMTYDDGYYGYGMVFSFILCDELLLVITIIMAMMIILTSDF